MAINALAQKAESFYSEQAPVSRGGIILVPQPSDDPRDPLNWSQTKKYLTLLVVSLASFAGGLQALANSAGLFPQAKAYHRTPTEITYSISAAIAGLAVGPFIWAPLSQAFGRCACIFWSMVLAITFNVWAALMTAESDYVAFILSRVFGGLVGSCSMTVGAHFIIDIFFLHERGKCFSFYTVMILLGTTASPTFSGFIVEHVSWPVQYWYNVALESLVLILCILFLDEPGWTRAGGDVYPMPPEPFLQRKAATYLYPRSIMPNKSFQQIWLLSLVPFTIGISPATILCGLFLLLTFAWAVLVNTMLAVFLQTPVSQGGYGFTPIQNAYFSFCGWVSLAAVQIYGLAVSDKLPMWICTRRSGMWKPEYRLFCLLFPSFFILPIGLGIFGAALNYHLHYMVLAFGAFLIFYSSISGVPVVVNYLAESFVSYPNEAAVALNFYRLVFGLVIPFFLIDWERAVGAGWTFGICAFITLFGCSLITLLILWGEAIRKWSFRGSLTEDGVIVMPAADHSSHPQEQTSEKHV